MFALLVAFCLFGIGLANSVSPFPTFMYDIELVSEPAFCSLVEKRGENGELSIDLAYSSFTGDTSSKDTVYQVEGVDDFLDKNSFQPKLLTDELQWPNEVTQVPDGLFDVRTWAVASSFFLPGKDNGSISLLDMSPGGSTDPVHISPFEDNQNWFYHRVEWMDMNGDGHLDAVTARAYGTGAAAEEAELVWLENPGLKTLSEAWNLHIIHQGKVDIAFRIHKMEMPDGSLSPVIISTGFWCKELAVIWSSTNNWQDTSSIQYLVVDTFGWYFDLEIFDLNMDGSLDILCTTWSQLGDPGALLAYEIPKDWQTEKWPMHVLEDNYRSWRIPGFGSPGTAQAFWPTVTMQLEGMKPYIMVTGDDDGKVFVVTPDDDADKTNWSYTSTMIYEQAEGTVGAIALADVNGDGYADVFMPSYEYKFIRVMTYLPLE